MEPEANKTERDYVLAKPNYYLLPKVSMGLSTHDLELVQFMSVSSVLGLRDFEFDEKIQV
jgi:hypothetical protein